MNARREFASTSSSLSLIDARHERALGHALRLRQHERAERERVQREAVDVRGHDQAQHRPAGHRRREQQAAPAAGPVEQRTEHRRDDGERRQREQEVEQDLRARLAGRGAEEQRVGERHRDEHVTRDADRVREREPRERRERRRLEPGP